MENMETISLLLQQAGNLLAVRSEWKKKTGGNFNIFSILEKDESELAHCRLLYELLNPDGSHCMGNSFLREFFHTVLHKPFPEDSVVHVFREYSFSGQNAGRIDLLIEGSHFCYPIEVKIFAGDQEQQVRRYTEFASNRAEDSQVYYLTLHGDEPSVYSTGGSNVSEVECLSFVAEIRAWLIKCGEIAWTIPAISEVIQQYINLIDKLAGYNQEDEFMEMVQKLVGNSRESYQSALAIAETLPVVRTKMMQKVFAEIETHIGSRLEIIQSDYIEEAELYYSTRRDHYPCLVYSLVKSAKHILGLEIAVDWQLFFGIGIYDDNGAFLAEATDHLPEMFPDDTWNEWPVLFEHSDGGLWWKYLPEHTHLNFKKCDGAYPDLYDEIRYNKIMQKIFTEIGECIAKLKGLDFTDQWIEGIIHNTGTT